MTNKEKWVQNAMRALELTKNEALQLWSDDHSDTLTPEQQVLENRAAAMERRYEKAEKQPKKQAVKKPKKTVKTDLEKQSIIDCLEDALTNGLKVDHITINGQSSMDFLIGNNSYTIKITKHR